MTQRMQNGETITLKSGETIKVGSGCSLWINGDASPYTVIGATPSGFRLLLQQAKATIEPGQAFTEGAKKATFKPNPDGGTREVVWSRKYKRYAPARNHGIYAVVFKYATAYNPHV